MARKAILFDLDGTLTDSGEGIMKCAQLGLAHFGIHVGDYRQLRDFVGPPLDLMFRKHGVPADKTDEAIAVYRSRYLTVGKFENFPYPGIPEMLERLKALGYQLYVATSKPEEPSKEIITHFGLDPYFDRVCGATFDGSRSSKADVIAYLLELCGRAEEIIMVGDTAFDVTGAKAHDIPCIGVAWGYGSIADMQEAGVSAIAHTVDELYNLLTK